MIRNLRVHLVSSNIELGILQLDLSSRSVTTRKLNASPLNYFVGGRGLASMITYDDVRAHNFDVLVIAPGFLLGILPFASKSSICGINELTHTFVSSTFGGQFGLKLRRSGVDAVVIRGQSANLTVIVIDGYDDVRFMDAGSLVNLGSYKTIDHLKGSLGNEYSVLAIGPAGENLVRFANAIADKSGVAGRSGVGMVLGNKRVKALAIHGHKSMKEVFREKGIEIRSAHLERKIKVLTRNVLEANAVAKSFSKQGTLGLIESLSSLGRLPARYWQSRYSKNKSQRLLSEVLQRVVAKDTCGGCPVKCKNVVHVGDRYVYGVEYEGVACFGPLLGIENTASTLELYCLANEMGMDVISLAHTLALYVHASGKENSSAEYLARLIEKISSRKGIGNLLADGEAAVADHFNVNNYAMISGGLGWEALDTKGLSASTLAHVTSTRGADHLRGLPDIELILPIELIDEVATSKFGDLIYEVFGNLRLVTDEKAKTVLRLLLLSECWKSVVDILGICKFMAQLENIFFEIPISQTDIIGLLSILSKSDISFRDVLKMGKDAVLIEHRINEALGRTYSVDDIPDRLRCGGISLLENALSIYRSVYND